MLVLKSIGLIELRWRDCTPSSAGGGSNELRDVSLELPLNSGAGDGAGASARFAATHILVISEVQCPSLRALALNG